MAEGLLPANTLLKDDGGRRRWLLAWGASADAEGAPLSKMLLGRGARLYPDECASPEVESPLVNIFGDYCGVRGRPSTMVLLLERMREELADRPACLVLLLACVLGFREYSTSLVRRSKKLLRRSYDGTTISSSGFVNAVRS